MVEPGAAVGAEVSVAELLLRADRLLTVDRLDQAEALYRQASERDPGNAAAVVGLARCAVERGDARAAYDLAVRVLELDPRNDQGLRMEARLSEVLAARGEPVTRPRWELSGDTSEARKPGLLGRLRGR